MAEQAQFDNVQSPLSSLTLTDKGLGFAQTLGEIDLRQPGPDSGRPQLAQEYRVIV